MYGAGDVNVAHAPNEHVSITELMTATKTVACLLADWCGVAGRGRRPRTLFDRPVRGDYNSSPRILGQVRGKGSIMERQGMLQRLAGGARISARVVGRPLDRDNTGPVRT